MVGSRARARLVVLTWMSCSLNAATVMQRVRVQRTPTQRIRMAASDEYAQSKASLHDYAQRRGWSVAYSLTEERGPDHSPEFRARVRVHANGLESNVNSELEGGWEKTRRRAEAAAATEFLKTLAKRPPDPPPLPPLEVQQNAKQHLLTACDANNWQAPVFASVRLGSQGFECAVTMANGPLAGQRFIGRGRRRVAAESVASTVAVNALKALLPSSCAAEGALQALREVAVKEGLRLQVEGCSVAIGRKSRVLSLAGPQGVGLSHWTNLSQSAWAKGQGLRRKDCADEAASRVMAQLETTWRAWRPQDGCNNYSRSQAR